MVIMMIIIPMVILIIMTTMIIAMMMIKVRVMTCQNDESIALITARTFLHEKPKRIEKL